MASVFKPTGSTKYVIFYTDETGRRRKKTAACDNAVSERIARDIENRVALLREGVVEPKAERFRRHDARALSAHLLERHSDMLAKGKTAKHADQYRDRASRVIALVKGTRIADIDPGRKTEAQGRAAELLVSILSRARFSDLSPESIQS